ncbi:hypothetical protein [Photorhabdus laumondii]|uniref:hypothetical protein n=1 Tax=Photorhabdus laumondii TaxID=2218628 RepID=UPI0015EBCC28|nr:hypothetical protein [Photorhabdus laumondii]
MESKAELPKWLREFPNADWFLLSNTNNRIIALLIKNFLSDDGEIVELGIDVAVSMTNLKSEQVSY